MLWRILIRNTGGRILRGKSLTGKKKKRNKGMGAWLVNKRRKEHCLIYADFIILQTWVNSIFTRDSSPLVQDPQGSDNEDFGANPQDFLHLLSQCLPVISFCWFCALFLSNLPTFKGPHVLSWKKRNIMVLALHWD